MKRKVIAYKNLPFRLPLFQSITMYLLLDKFQVSGVVYGIFIALFAILWIIIICDTFNREHIDLDKL